MRDRYDLVIVGMGSAGIAAADMAATLPIRVAAVESGRVGGECLWTGCVPSKALLASAKVAHLMRSADQWGLPATDPEISTAAVWRRVRAVQEGLARTDDDPRRFESLGVEVVQGRARLVNPHTVAVGQRLLHTRYTLVCTGSSPTAPPVPGLADAGYLTNEDVFELDSPPSSMIVIGGGPMGIELAQAFRRLGMATTVIERHDGILPTEEPDLVAVLAGMLAAEGVILETGVNLTRVSAEDGTNVVQGVKAGRARRWEAAGVLVAAGRRPNVQGLGLDDIGVSTTPTGVVVDDRMRSTIPSIYAAGDVTGRPMFTHAASHEAVRAVRDMFFPGRGTVESLVPWCTFTDPELAHVGLTSPEARHRHGDAVEVHWVGLEHSDRARAEGHTEGAVVAVTVDGVVVGAHILAPAAGELIHELAWAVQRGQRLDELASLIHVYPTLSNSVVQLAARAAYARAGRFHWTVRAGRLLHRLRLGP